MCTKSPEVKDVMRERILRKVKNELGRKKVNIEIESLTSPDIYWWERIERTPVE